ncbi:MAG: hypothetical protein WAK26_13375 [Terracidiphilus sp.]
MNLAKTIRSGKNGDNADRNARQEAEIGQILATEEKLIPSSGFMASVMERVQHDAAPPPPIPFPWTWAVAGILLVGGVIVWGALEVVRLGLPTFHMVGLRSLGLTLPQIPAVYVSPVEEVGWVALALGVSLLCCLFSRRMAGSGGLL